MPKPSDYDGLTEEQLRERLVVAETVCVLFGWSARTDNDPLTEAWMEWAAEVGDYTGPKFHHDLNEDRLHKLATARRKKNADTLERIERLLGQQ